MEQSAVIDETFAGLADPVQTFEMGRADLTEDRPGAILVAEVRDFRADGGFARLADARDADRVRGEEIDSASKQPRKVHDARGVGGHDEGKPSSDI